MTQSIAIAALLVYPTAPTLTSVDPAELELPILNFDRFHQPCLFSQRRVADAQTLVT